MIIIFRTACQKAYLISLIILKGSDNLPGINLHESYCFARCLVTAEALYKRYCIRTLDAIVLILKTSNYLQFVLVYFPLVNGSVLQIELHFSVLTHSRRADVAG